MVLDEYDVQRFLPVRYRFVKRYTEFDRFQNEYESGEYVNKKV